MHDETKPFSLLYLLPGKRRWVGQLLNPLQLEVPQARNMDQAIYGEVLSSYVSCTKRGGVRVTILGPLQKVKECIYLKDAFP
jgi:hypothetical protein